MPDTLRFIVCPLSPTICLQKRTYLQFHIDGHSDEAAPEYVREMPFFHWPKNETEEKAMLQKNDMFIQVSSSSLILRHPILHSLQSSST